jgi:hypothetical protein
MKSLAHPNWPYLGTSFEWRGFRVKIERRLMEEEESALWKALMASATVVYEPQQTIYQKQNFGPELE